MNFIGLNTLFAAAGSASLRHRFIMLVVAVLGLAFLAVAMFSYLVSRERLHDVIVSKELPLTAEVLHAKIQRDFAKYLQASAVMASDPFVRAWIVGGEKDPTPVQAYLAEMQRVNTAFTAYFVSDRTHRYYVPKGVLKTVSRNDEHDDWFFALENATVPYTVEVDTDQTHDDALTVFINYRVVDENNRFLGIAGLGLNVDAVRTGLAHYRRLYDLDIYFVDRDGKMMMGGGRASFPDIRSAEGLAGLAPMILGGEGRAFEYVRDGQTHLLQTRFMPELNWYLVVEGIEDSVLGDIRHVLYLNLLIAAAATAMVAFLLAMMVTRFRVALDKVATIDPLTGLTNRHAFPVLFNQTVKADRRVHRPTSLVLFDVDKLRAVNTRFGHVSGDQTLKSVAAAVEHHSRPNDIVCRWGGDQIILLLKDCTMNKAMAIADTIRQEIEGCGKDEAPITVSGGAAEVKESERAGSVLVRAEEGLRAARDAGGNCVISSGRSFEH